MKILVKTIVMLFLIAFVASCDKRINTRVKANNNYLKIKDNIIYGILNKDSMFSYNIDDNKLIEYFSEKSISKRHMLSDSSGYFFINDNEDSLIHISNKGLLKWQVSIFYNDYIFSEVNPEDRVYEFYDIGSAIKVKGIVSDAVIRKIDGELLSKQMSNPDISYTSDETVFSFNKKFIESTDTSSWYFKGEITPLNNTKDFSFQPLRFKEDLIFANYIGGKHKIVSSLKKKRGLKVYSIAENHLDIDTFQTYTNQVLFSSFLNYSDNWKKTNNEISFYESDEVYLIQGDSIVSIPYKFNLIADMFYHENQLHVLDATGVYKIVGNQPQIIWRVGDEIGVRKVFLYKDKVAYINSKKELMITELD